MIKVLSTIKEKNVQTDRSGINDYKNYYFCVILHIGFNVAPKT